MEKGFTMVLFTLMNVCSPESIMGALCYKGQDMSVIMKKDAAKKCSSRKYLFLKKVLPFQIFLPKICKVY